MSCLSADDIFDAGAQVQREKVQLGDIGHVWVRPLTIGERNVMEEERAELAKQLGRKRTTALFREKLLRRCCENDQGAAIFDTEDETKLSKLPAPLVEPLINAILRINGWDEKEDQDFFQESSTPTPSSNSSSSSPTTSA